MLLAGDRCPTTSSRPAAGDYQDLAHALVGLVGEGQNFDGNGMYVRFQTGGGSQSVSLGSQSASSGQLFGNNPEVPIGNRPAYPGKRPPYKPEVPCYTQKLPNLNGPAAAKSLPTGAPATSAKVASAREKLKREADLSVVRAKLKPFESATRKPSAEKAK